MITLDTIRENLIYEIKHSKFNQTQIAKQLSVKQQSVNNYVTGKSLPALDTFANLCVLLDVDPAEILGIKK